MKPRLYRGRPVGQTKKSERREGLGRSNARARRLGCADDGGGKKVCSGARTLDELLHTLVVGKPDCGRRGDAKTLWCGVERVWWVFLWSQMGRWVHGTMGLPRVTSPPGRDFFFFAAQIDQRGQSGEEGEADGELYREISNSWRDSEKEETQTILRGGRKGTRWPENESSEWGSFTVW